MELLVTTDLEPVQQVKATIEANKQSVMALARFPKLERHTQGRAHFSGQLTSLQTQYQNGRMSVAAQRATVLRN